MRSTLTAIVSLVAAGSFIRTPAAPAQAVADDFGWQAAVAAGTGAGRVSTDNNGNS